MDRAALVIGAIMYDFGRSITKPTLHYTLEKWSTTVLAEVVGLVALVESKSVCFHITAFYFATDIFPVRPD